MGMSGFSRSGGDEAGGGLLGVLCDRGGDDENVASASRNRSRETGDLEGGDKIGSPIAARSTVQEKEDRLRNWAKTNPEKASGRSSFAFAISFAVRRSHINRSSSMLWFLGNSTQKFYKCNIKF